MLCIIALGCFFLAQVQHGGGGWSANVFFAWGWIGLLIFLRNEKKQCAKSGWIAKSVTEKNNRRVDCAEAVKKTPAMKRDKLCKPRGTRGEDFCLPGILPGGATCNVLSGETCPLFSKCIESKFYFKSYNK